MTTTTTTSTIREDDFIVHIEDTELVNAIRGGKIVQVTWNELDESEKRQAYVNMFLSAGVEMGA